MTNNIQQAVRRENITLFRDSSRVIARPLIPDDTVRIKRTIGRVLALSDAAADAAFAAVQRDYANRHKDLNGILRRHYERIAEHVPASAKLRETVKLLIGAYFTMEYSIESAALFNPSIVPHPDQSGLPAGALRFVMSLRATGEGHISSIVFRTGTITAETVISFDEKSKYAELPEIGRGSVPGDSNYAARFRPDQAFSERVIFPVLKCESKGIEDARFVRFVEETGEVRYFATYTAYDGFNILPQLIETKDFLTFDIITLNGTAVQNKGMGLFPRKVNGKYYMLSRQDGETNKIMMSDDIYTWNSAAQIQDPAEPWEFVQIGNCGSPIETSKGWLVLTHGVGPMRQYSIGAILLDLHDPSKVIGRLKQPLLMPNEQEREGYVPNVVYSCGSLVHHDTLVLPYAMSDITSGVAVVPLAAVLEAMEPMN
jgi:predicted GH43/DUF377 family glycosyl hydrolase